MIQHGSQVLISGSDLLSTEDIDMIIEQNLKYGLLSVDEIDRRHATFHGLCYSIGKQIASTKIEKLFYANTAVLEARGMEHRKIAAVVETNRMLNDAKEFNLGNLANTSFSVQEEDGKISEQYDTAIISEAPAAPRRARGR